ncbi:MAG: YfaZ family protein [Pseudomonadales bacterium]|nr:YfaZ family protein [Pseudomonadales bacterium]
MKFALSTLTLISLFLFPTVSFSNQVNLDLSDETIHVAFATKPSKKSLNVSASFLHHEDDGEVYAIGAFAQSPINNRQDLHGSLGGRFYYLDADGPDGYGIGLGGEVGYKIPSVQGLSVHGEAYYAPKVTMFVDIERFVDVTVRIKYRILEQGAAYLGYRSQKVHIKHGGSENIDEGVHVGISLQF